MNRFKAFRPLFSETFVITRSAFSQLTVRNRDNQYFAERFLSCQAAGPLAAYRPDYFVSGHDHAFPYTSGQSWNQKLGYMSLLVPGQLLGAPFPNYIKLDTESGELSWHTASEAWIPEDGLYDHLVLKLTKIDD